MFFGVDGSGRQRLCDGVARHDFLRVGGLGLAGLTWADLLRLRAQAGNKPKRRYRSVIMIVLSGGSSHIDTYDVKPCAGEVPRRVPAHSERGLRPMDLLEYGEPIAELLSAAGRGGSAG